MKAKGDVAKKMKYEMGDIVFASEAVKKENDDTIKSHLFVIIDNDGNVVPADYFGFVVSSNLNKSKENSNFRYNERINKDKDNNLRTDSIVKCDQLMSIPFENINMKIGTVGAEDLTRFLEAFRKFLEEN